MRTLANSEDTDEMHHDAAFHQRLHCLQKQKRSSEKELSNLEIITFNPLLYIIDHPKFIVSSQQKEQSIDA